MSRFKLIQNKDLRQGMDVRYKKSWYWIFEQDRKVYGLGSGEKEDDVVFDELPSDLILATRLPICKL